MRYIIFFLLLFQVEFLSADQTDHNKKTICLNMIVKNEADVIERCLESIKNLIDYWVIFDTGSNDGTQEIIRKFLKDIPGELHQSEWINFEHNRNQALLAAKNKADYLLFIDADEIFEFEKNFSLPDLNKDVYFVIVRQIGSVEFKRIALVNNHLHWVWKGVLHESVVSESAQTQALLENVVNICNSMVGARSKVPQKEKYLKDAEILKKALLNEPGNSRLLFYLGQSYFAASEYQLALESFKKRAEIQTGEEQETYAALYNIGLCQEKLGNFTDAISSYFIAYQHRSIRAEPLFRLATIYRKQGNYLLGYLLAKHAISLDYPQNDMCVEYITYNYALLIEFANCALLLGKFQEGFDACLKLLENPTLPKEIELKVLQNLEIAKLNLKNLNSNKTSL